MVMIQSYNKLPRALRNNCNAICVFPALRSEIETIKDEVAPAEYTKKEFEKLLKYCMSEQHSFFYINRHAKPDQRLRRNLDEVLEHEKFTDVGSEIVKFSQSGGNHRLSDNGFEQLEFVKSGFKIKK
jgi:phytoene/squalene synthetase